MTLEADDLESHVRWIYRTAGYSRRDPPGPAHLIGGVLGFDAISLAESHELPIAWLARDSDKRFIVRVHPSLSGARRSYWLSMALANWRCETAHISLSNVDTLAENLLLPTKALLHELGGSAVINVQELAERYGAPASIVRRRLWDVCPPGQSFRTA